MCSPSHYILTSMVANTPMPFFWLGKDYNEQLVAGQAPNVEVSQASDFFWGLVQDLYLVEGFSYKETISWKKLGLLLRSRSSMCAVLQGLPGSLPWGCLLTFLNDFLSQQKGMTIANATWVSLSAFLLCRVCLCSLLCMHRSYVIKR